MFLRYLGSFAIQPIHVVVIQGGEAVNNHEI